MTDICDKSYKLETLAAEERSKVFDNSTGFATKAARTAKDLELPVRATPSEGVGAASMRGSTGELRGAHAYQLTVRWTWVTSSGSSTGCGRPTRE